jgi:hypothetical protein
MAVEECPNCESRECFCKQIVRICECAETFICSVCAISKLSKLNASPGKDERIDFHAKRIDYLEKRVNDLVEKIALLEKSIDSDRAMVWESFRIRDNLRNGYG